MNATTLLENWNWDPVPVVASVTGAAAFGILFRSRARWGYVVAALAIVWIALLSPLNALANGVLFSAHMAQHILLLLIIPALLIAALPRSFSLRGQTRKNPAATAMGAMAVLGWAAGVGSMWFWHVPQLCDAAATHVSVHSLQTFSLLAMGSLFWWPILAPAARDRLSPPIGVGYLFTACLACTALGILLTLTSIDVCPVFRTPLRASQPFASYRQLLSADSDRQVGGLLMWVPMCSVYLGAILLELWRWFGAPAQPTVEASR